MIYSIIAVVVIPLLYLITRPLLWPIILTIFRQFIWLHHTKAYTGFPVGFGMVFHTFFSTFLISFGWIISNVAFGIYMSMGPIHRGELLTAKSSDKNGTLIDGLHHHERQLNCILAYQELAQISLNHSARRLELFTDIDRKPTAWERVNNECMSLLTEVSDKLKPKSSSKKSKNGTAGSGTGPEAGRGGLNPNVNGGLNNNLQGVDNAGVITIKSANVFAHKTQGHHLIESIQDKDAQSSKKVVGLMDLVAIKFRNFVKGYPKALELVTSSKYGAPFRFTLERKARQILPNPIQTAAGIIAISSLVEASREEDKFGVVQGSIASILDKMVEVRGLLHKYMANPPKHWSDVASKDTTAASLQDMDDVLDVLESGIQCIVVAFQANLQDLKLSPRVQEYIYELTSQPVLNDSFYN